MPKDNTSARPISHRGWFLVGPTASGKTAVAHELARRLGVGVLSADAMAVYRGMEIGTAKPTAEERKAFDYLGIDLADPSRRFSVGAYLASVRNQIHDRPEPDRVRLVAGGTGLYVRALLEGLDASAASAAEHRDYTDRLYREGGLEALHQALRQCAPGRIETLRDPRNPRRVARAIEQALSGASADAVRTWSSRPRGPLAGLRRSPEELAGRIEERVRRMFAGGLLEEAAEWLKREPPLSDTALHAIGYREAFSVVTGTCSVETAVARTAARTRALARRQRTWFRTQADVHWVDVTGDTEVEKTADQVQTIWEQHGLVTFHI